MTERKFLLGDVVELRSGSAEMTVTEYLKPDATTEPAYRCTYFHEGRFLDAILIEPAIQKAHGED